MTIRDVARAAGVSPTTVSNFLNSRVDRMTSETKRRVEQAIAELGYRPSPVARQLRTGRTTVIGLVVPSVANPFWGALAQSVESAAVSVGWQVLLCNSERIRERERGYVEELWSAGVRSVVLGSSLPSLDHLNHIISSGLRLIAFDREPQTGDPPGITNISIDNYEGARMATEYLLELGHRRIGFISGPIATVSRRRRLAGYKRALTDHGVKCDPALVWSRQLDSISNYGDTANAELGRTGTEELLRLDDPPTAIVAVNDMYAMGVCAALQDSGTPAPNISVIGFDDIALASLYNPPLTTVRQPLEAMAMQAIRALQDDTPSGMVSSTTPELIVRGSTAPPTR